MSRSRKGSKPPGYEYWSRRPTGGGLGKKAKKFTHKMERIQQKSETHHELKGTEI